MCCIIYKPQGVQMPSLNILDKIKRVNNHGFGFMATNGMQSRKYKTMSYDRLLAQLKKVKTDEDCIIHMRYATHGSKCTANCHPFEENGVYFAHNGVLNINPIEDMTDSETAFKTILYPCIEAYGIDFIKVRDVIAKMIGSSKFAFICNQRVRLFGRYEILNGVYYSNLRWL